MAIKWKLFILLVWKNFTVRKRHWKDILFGQILIPLILFSLIQAIRDFIPLENFNEKGSELGSSVDELKSILEILKNGERNLHVYYLPKNSYTQELMERTRFCAGLPESNIEGFSSEGSMLKQYNSIKLEQQLDKILAIVFKNPKELNSRSKHLEYIIRSEKSSLDTGDERFLRVTPFAQIQMCLDESFIKSISNSSFKSEISIQEMPFSEQNSKTKSVPDALRTFYILITLIAFLTPLSIEVKYPANEKSIGVNHLMSMNGVKLYQNLRSWLITGLMCSVFYVVPCLILYKISFSSYSSPRLSHGNIILVAIMYFTHIAHLLAFGIHIASYFSKSIFRSLAIPFIYFGSYYFQTYLIKHQSFAIIPYLGIIFPNMLLHRLIEEIDVYERKLVGVGWQNIFIVGDTNYSAAGSLGIILIFSIFGLLLHFSLALYASALFPGKYGVAKHPLYFINFFKSKKVSSEEASYECNYNVKGKPFEPVPKNAYTPGIQIRNLKKSYLTNIFSGVKHQALGGISLDFYKGQITALLGHNGAGKTTLMSILTGCLSPSEGTVFINGKNISEDMDEIITDLGLCPQEDILFPDLTVFEQILFFGMLKNKNQTRSQVTNSVYNLLLKLKLTEKRNKLPPKLSGGQKRRVCLGMALIGDASTLILDEPTSGMDPETRRESWDILLKMRGEKTILISTHNMEEADVLGDRTAIIELGKLKSYGTPLFLKKFYGEGNVEVTLSTEDGCNIELIKHQLSEESRLISNDGGKVVFTIPYTDRLPSDLDRIEEQKKKFGITGISVSLITLEQVFLRATKEDYNDKGNNDVPIEEIKKVEGLQLLLQSITALFLKKFTYMRKNILPYVLMVLLPLIGIALLAAVSKNVSDPDEDPIRLNNYPDPVVFYYSSDEVFGKMYEATVEHFNGKAIKTENTNISSALLNFETNDPSVYRNNLVAGASFLSVKSQEINVTALYSKTIFQSIPITINLLSNTIIKHKAGKDYQIDISSQYLPKAFNFAKLSDQPFEDNSQANVFIFILFTSLALYVLHPLKESSAGIKDLQRMTGVSSYLYWGTLFLFDFLVFFIVIILILFGFYFMDITLDLRLLRGNEIGIMFLLFILLAMSILPFIYLFSFTKKKSGTVVNILIYVFLLTIFVEVIVEVLIMAATGRNQNLREWLIAIERRVFMLIPSVSFYYGQSDFFKIANRNALCRKMPEYLLDFKCGQENKCCELNCSGGYCKKSFEYFKDFGKEVTLGESMLFLLLSCFLYFIILEILERKLISLLILKIQNRQPPKIQEVDEQVASEKSLVASEISRLKDKVQNEDVNGGYSFINPVSETESIYLVHELNKFYGNLPAVKEISFSVKKKECFGLLGVNGAGKSTTFRMLTGLEFPNNGVMYLNEKEISTNQKEYLRQMGYCPQSHTLIESLNSRDHLELFAYLRGIPKCQISTEVDNWIKRLKLNLCANNPAGSYSGGNKRRLNIAIALIGNPNLLLLDEPTTGVDPAARRTLWRVIKSCQLAGQSIILTSHSMEECEALCNRLAIMVKGRFVCIGPGEQLKQRFGAGFDISIKMNPGRKDDDVLNIKKDMEETLECELRDEHMAYLTYHVTNSETKWQTMYGVMTDLKEKYSCIEDYSVLSATLEQLFLQFARTDTNDNN